MNKIKLIVTSLLLLDAWSACVAAEPAAKPNIVVILIDDMGYGDIGCFGSKMNRTPNLDRMVSEGMKMTSFYSAPLCSASRSQIMTGCYARRLSMPSVLFPDSGTGINPSEKTIADLLKPLGYATMIVGKWHLGDQPEFLPTQHGFDHYFGLPYSNDMGGETVKGNDTAKKGKGNGKNSRPPLPLIRDDKVIEAPANQDTLTSRYTDEAVKFITENKDHPFFLYLPHTAVHHPWHPGDAFKGKSKNGLYGDWIEEMDWSVGRVLATLKELKLDKNTLVIFTSDNGGIKGSRGGTGIPSNAPLQGYKGSTWEGGLRESSIAWWPGKIAPGSVSDAMLSEMDILPTVVKLAGGQVPTDRKIDGLDIWPVLSGQSKTSPHEALFYWQKGRIIAAVRSGPWKLSVVAQKEGEGKEEASAEGEAAQGELKLYNLDQDIGETTNVAAQNPDVVKRLQVLIAKMEADLGKNGSGIRPPGHVDHPKPLLMRTVSEYD
jgi:arylsulfatase A-like enzyme